MTSRERVKRAMHYQSVDKVPVRHLYTSVGFYEHGEKLNDLFATLPGDFDPYRRHPIEQPNPEDFDADGRYHTFVTDEWGINWEYRIFGRAGIPYNYPVRTPEEAALYKAPKPAGCEGPELEAFIQGIKKKQEQGYYAMSCCSDLYQKLLQLYGDENVLCDILMDDPGINKLADTIIEYDAALVEQAVKAGCDGLLFLDDYGLERGLVMSPECWRRFFKPRLKKLFKPALDAGIDIHFHSCGQISSILTDLKDVGATSIWPQLPVYDMAELAKRCRELELAVEIHTDRAHTMTHGTPQQVRDLVNREFETFRVMDGGSWFNVEVDNGFPYENIEALVETIAQYR